MERGKFIVLEGIDGAGTTTQSELLYRALVEKGYPAELTAEPSQGPVGRLIRSYLRGELKFSERYLGAHSLALLFAGDRLEHLANQVQPWLEQGKIVISDRYLLSSLAYQSIDCELDWVITLNREAPPPDLAILLDLPTEVALKRISQRSLWPELFEKIEVQEKVRENYLRLAREFYSDLKIMVLNANRSVDEVFTELSKIVINFLESFQLKD